MGLAFENLDNVTRPLMLSEIEGDETAQRIYISNHLNEIGVNLWPRLLKESAKDGNDDSLAEELRRAGCFKNQVERRKPKGGYSLVAVPHTAAQTLAEAQFNVYYMRSLAIQAIESNRALIVYRAKQVEVPRSSSELLMGKSLDPTSVLKALRQTIGVEPPTNIPLPNSGLTVRLV